MDIADIETNATGLAKFWGFANDSRVHQLKREGMSLVKTENGKYSVVASNMAYLEHLKTKLPSGKSAGTAKRKLDAEVRLAEFKAREAERKEEIDLGLLHHKKDIVEVWNRDLRQMKNSCWKWLQECMDISKLKPMQREQRENEFVAFFNDLANREYRNTDTTTNNREN